MTRKDFILIAEALKAARTPFQGDTPHPDAAGMAGVDNAAHHVADALSTTNPNFDRVRFLRACGLPEQS